MANMFDKAFVIGYHDGYHGDMWDKEKYHKDLQPQMWIKYKHGWEAGFLSKVEDKELEIMVNAIGTAGQ